MNFNGFTAARFAPSIELKYGFHNYSFSNPVEVLVLDNPKNLNAFFSKLEKRIKKYYAAGFFSYELGFLLDDAFGKMKKTRFPYAVFGIFEKPAEIKFSNVAKMQMPRVDGPKLNISKRRYKACIKKIKRHIYEGDIYQANFTMKYKFGFCGSPEDLFENLKARQKTAYNAFFRFGNCFILSLSPELFFAKVGRKIVMKPMKGTIERGRFSEEDSAKSIFLANDPKNRSENLMIVDLLRNDVGKISIPGSVKVKKLFEVEKYGTLFQMTSTIESYLRKHTTAAELIRAVFPSGSVTGAPKIRSMQILKDLEKEKRGIYTGAVGYFTPHGNAVFNVAIRTVLLNGVRGEMGVGGGIVNDSNADDEFNECRLKAKFFHKKTPPKFSLIETILYRNGFEHLNSHLSRLKNSAEYFGFNFKRKKIVRKLNLLKNSFEKKPYRVRLLLSEDGSVSASATSIKPTDATLKITLSDVTTNSSDYFFFHKTTKRDIYNSELAKAREKGFFDVVFANEKGEITEGAITNVYIKKGADIFTSPVKCGLLNGVIRKIMLNKRALKEKIISVKELLEADAVFVSNSIIGFRQAKLQKKGTVC